MNLVQMVSSDSISPLLDISANIISNESWWPLTPTVSETFQMFPLPAMATATFFNSFSWPTGHFLSLLIPNPVVPLTLHIRYHPVSSLLLPSSFETLLNGFQVWKIWALLLVKLPIVCELYSGCSEHFG